MTKSDLHYTSLNFVKLVFVAAFMLLVVSSAVLGQVEGVEHVVILGFDGMSPDGIQKAPTPHLDKIIENGAFTFHARAVLPTSSSQNWASMIMGAGPEQHGITSNKWERDTFVLPPIVTGMENIFPTIFSILRQQRPAAKIGVFYDWSGFGRLFEKSAVDVEMDTKGPEKTIEEAIKYIKNEKPDLTFIHLDHVDHAGHEFGHGTDEYYRAVEETDKLVGELLEGFKTAGIADKTVLIITADHGGQGKGHGGETLAEIETPWIAYGVGVKKGREIMDPVNIYDTASTAAYLLGLKQPFAWIARPVLSAFENK